MKIKVGVFFGGRSVEHEVSVISAMQAIAAMDRNRYEPVAIYMTKDGRFLTGEGFDTIDSYRDLPALLKRGTEVTFAREGKAVVMLVHPAPKLRSAVLGTLDVALPVVHGTHTEDGTLAGFLDTLQLPYAGCDVMSGALCMDKGKVKHCLAAVGVPVLPHLTFHGQRIAVNGEDICADIEAQIGYPVIVKPNNLGSSVGIQIARDRTALRTALEYAARFAEWVLVERAVTAIREINCAVLGDAVEAQASVCEQPSGSDEILSYQDKYLSGNGGQKGMARATRQIPADIPDALTKTIQDMAVKAFQSLGCGGVARIDFILDDADGSVYVNELNTVPGSLAFYLFEPMGISFTQLVTKLIELAFKRSRDNDALSFTFETNLLAQANLGGIKK